MGDGQTKTFDSLFIFLLFIQTIKAKKHQRNKRTFMFITYINQVIFGNF